MAGNLNTKTDFKKWIKAMVLKSEYTENMCYMISSLFKIQNQIFFQGECHTIYIVLSKRYLIQVYRILTMVLYSSSNIG